MANVLKLERGPHGSTALTRIKVELAELPRAKLLQVNLEVQEAVTTVLGAVPEVQGMRARIAKELPAFDLANIDKLALFAEAVAEADAGLRIVPSSDHRHALLHEAKRQRTLLHALATALTSRAFTLMIVAYNEVRRALAYLRAHEGDAESIAPGLYKGRPRRRTARGRRAP